LNTVAANTAIPKRRRWRTVLALSAAAFVDSSENTALSILWPYMAPALGVRVGQLGTVLGLGDLVRTLTLPFWGYAADRYSRKVLLVGITGFWGVWTLALAFVQSYTQLLTVRALATLGLGVLWPTAFALLSDLFERKERGRAAGIMTAVSFAGATGAFAILPALANRHPEGWRDGFVMMGLASMATGLLLLVIHDPPRGSADATADSLHTGTVAPRQTLRLSDLRVITRVRSWWVLLFHQAIDAIALAVLYGWFFTWLEGLGLGEAAFGAVALLALGNLVGHAFFGWLGDYLDARNPNYGRAAMAQIGLLVSIPTLAGLIAFGGRGVGLLMAFGLLAGIALSSVDTGARWPMAQGVLPAEARATGRAMLDMVVNAVAALALTLSGWLVDGLSGNVTAMMLVMIPLPKLISSLLWVPIFWSYPRDRVQGVPAPLRQ
jgi:MFS family permease